MKEYMQYCPISKAVEILGERWTILVMRELLMGSRHFNDIARGLPGMSRTMLTKRLRQLEQADLIERIDGTYAPTEAGEDLRAIVFGLGDWGVKWVLQDPTAEECDVELLMWWAHSRLDTSPLPDRRVVLHFRFSDQPEQFWVVIEDVGCSICLSDPGFGNDATVSADAASLHKIWYGRDSITGAVKDGRLRFEGDRAIVRRLPQVLTLADAVEMGATVSSPRPTMFIP